MLRDWVDRQFVSERELTEALEGTGKPLAATIRPLMRANNTSHVITVPNGREWSILSLTLMGADAGNHNVVVTIFDDQNNEVFFYTTDTIPAGADTTNVSPNGETYFFTVAALSRTFAGVKLPFGRLLSNWRIVVAYQFGGTGTMEGVIMEHW